jgi:hypothetical protein
VFHNAVGHEELGILWPMISALDQPNFLFAQRFAMGISAIDFVRRPITDVAVENDQRRPAFGFLKNCKSVFDPLQIIGIVDALHVPLIGKETRGYVFGKGDAGVAFDGDVVVVVDPTQILEPKMSS